MHRSRLPIFPLSIVLFPNTPQLLHIFEPRYRQMLADSLAADRRFGISYVDPAGGTDPRPRSGDVGCSAYIRSHQPLPDGRSDILVFGEQRYALREYVHVDKLYLVAEVEYFEDDDSPGVDSSEPATVVRQAFSALVQKVNPATTGGELLTLSADPTQLSFQVAAALDIDATHKQELLRLRSTTERLRRLQSHLRQASKRAATQTAMQLHARRNGKGRRAGSAPLP